MTKYAVAVNFAVLFENISTTVKVHMTRNFLLAYSKEPSK